MTYNYGEYAQIFENYDTSDISSGEQVDSNNAEIVMFKYNWRIRHIIRNNMQCNSVSEEVVSPPFPNSANSGLIWTLKAMQSRAAHAFSVKLVLASSHIQEVTANYKFMLLSSLGKVLVNWKVGPKKAFKLDEHPVPSEFIELDPKVIYGGELHFVSIVCEITVPASQVYPTNIQRIPKSSTNAKFQFSGQLQTMFENAEFSDVTFSVHGKELQAHKVILAAESPVFKAMFGHDMMEKKHNRVEISDIEFEVLRELMRFIYTDTVFNLERMAKDLLVASDKYELEKLKNICERVLCENVTTENVAEMLIFADTYNVDLLKEKAKEYIIGHSNAVSNTSGWKLMIDTHPHLLAEAFLALSKRTNPKSATEAQDKTRSLQPASESSFSSSSQRLFPFAARDSLNLVFSKNSSLTTVWRSNYKEL